MCLDIEEKTYLIPSKKNVKGKARTGNILRAQSSPGWVLVTLPVHLGLRILMIVSCATICEAKIRSLKFMIDTVIRLPLNSAAKIYKVRSRVFKAR